MEAFRRTCVLCASSTQGPLSPQDETLFTSIYKLVVLPTLDESGESFYSWPRDNLLEETLKGLKEKKYSVCDSCHCLATQALHQKEKTEDMKREVKLLQNQLVLLLRRLHEQVDSYNEEIKKIERVVRKSEVHFGYQAELGTKEQVQLVHGRIASLVSQLHLFQNNLHQKITSGGFSISAPGRDLVSPHHEDTESSIENVEQISCEATILEEPEDRIDPLSVNNFYRHSIFGGEDSSPNCSQNDVPNGLGDKTQSKAKPVSGPPVTCFREGLIKRAMEREQKRKNGDEFHENPLIRYFLRFDEILQSFFVGHVQVQLSSTPLGDVLECTGVDCSTRWVAPGNNECATTFDRDIRNHVIGKHLGGFTCRVCCLTLNSYFKLMQHFKKEHPGQKPLNDDPFERIRTKSPRKSPRQRPPGSSSSSKKIPARFKQKSPPRLGKSPNLPHDEVVASPSEGLKLVRVTMNNAIQSLGDPGTSAHSQQYFSPQLISYPIPTAPTHCHNTRKSRKGS